MTKQNIHELPVFPIYLLNKVSNPLPFTISKVDSQGHFSMIYCHVGENLTQLAELLLKNYTDETKVTQLISLGDLLKVGESPMAMTNAWYVTNKSTTEISSDPRVLVSPMALVSGNWEQIGRKVDYSRIPDTCFAFSTIDYEQGWTDPTVSNQIYIHNGNDAMMSFDLLGATLFFQSRRFVYSVPIGMAKTATTTDNWKKQLKALMTSVYRLSFSNSGGRLVNFIYIQGVWYLFLGSADEIYVPLNRLVLA